MRCANKTVVNYGQSSSKLPISSPSVVHHLHLRITDAHLCAALPHNDRVIRDNKERGELSVAHNVVRQLSISSEYKSGSHCSHNREIEKEALLKYT